MLRAQGNQGGSSSQDRALEPRELHRERALEICRKAPQGFIRASEATTGGWRERGRGAKMGQGTGRRWRAVPCSHRSPGILLIPSNQTAKLIVHKVLGRTFRKVWPQ